MRNLETREFYTPKEIAAKIGIHYCTLLEWMKDPKKRSKLPPFKKITFNTRVFPIEEYENWKRNF